MVDLIPEDSNVIDGTEETTTDVQKRKGVQCDKMLMLVYRILRCEVNKFLCFQKCGGVVALIPTWLTYTRRFEPLAARSWKKQAGAASHGQVQIP